MKGTLEEGMNFLMECLVLNLYMKMECSNFSSNRGCSCCNSFHEKRDNYGSKYFQTNQLLRSLLRYVWVKVKVQLSIGLPLLNPEELCLKLEVPLSVAEALRLAAQKLPVKTKFVVARDFEA
jgi:hypothetical protein